MTTTDRRRRNRWPVRLLATCAWGPAGRRREAGAWVKDVNEEGLCLASRESVDDDALPFRPGRKVTVRGFFYDERGEHALEAAVRWVRPEAEGGWTAGLELVGQTVRPASYRDFLRVVRDEAA